MTMGKAVVVVVLVVVLIGAIGVTIVVNVRTDDAATGGKMGEPAAIEQRQQQRELSENDRKFRAGKVRNSPGKEF